MSTVLPWQLSGRAMSPPSPGFVLGEGESARVPATARAMPGDRQAVSAHGLVPDEMSEGLAVDADPVPPGAAPETSGGKVQDSVDVAPKLLRGVDPETHVGRGQDSAPANVRPLRGLNANQAAYRDQGSVRENLRLRRAAMLLHLEGEHPAREEPVSARLVKEEWAARARDRGDREPLPLLPVNPQPRLMISRLSEDEGFR